MAALDARPSSLPPSQLAALGDDALADLVAAGSDDAFAALDARHRARLTRYARAFTATPADAEDAVQDALVRAVRALRGGSRPEALGPWLHRIVRNCALDLLAARRRQPVAELLEHAHPPAEDAQAAVERRLGLRSILADAGGLPATQRSALVLRELEGRTYADIAHELDVTVPAVKSLLVRARTGLRRARDERRAAAWLPLPLLHRLSHALQPLGAAGTPKVAAAAVALAAAVPLAPLATHQLGARHHRAAAGGARPAAVVHAAPPRHTSAALRCAALAPPAEYGDDAHPRCP